jgi:hypothetical protein
MYQSRRNANRRLGHSQISTPPAILWSFSLSAGLLSSHWQPFDESRQAIDKIQPGNANLQLTGDDLAKRSSLTATTQAITPGHARLFGYLATIHLASGVECQLTVASCGGSAATCNH